MHRDFLITKILLGFTILVLVIWAICWFLDEKSVRDGLGGWDDVSILTANLACGHNGPHLGGLPCQT